MTTAQHTSYMNANLPNLKAQTHELGEAGLLKEEREQIVPGAPLEKEPASPARAPHSPAASASDLTMGSPGTSKEQEEMERQLLRIEEVSVEGADVLVKVPADLVGRMIGKHGTVIKELQLQSGAFINMSKDGEVFRIARISGGQAEARLCACLLVEKFTSADNAEKRARLEELIAHYRVVGNRPVRQYVVESFTMPAETLARIVGRGGLLLRELQDKSHAKIDLPRSTGSDEARKVVTISGTSPEVAACRELLRSVMHDYPTHYPEESYYQYDPAHQVVPSRTPYYPPHYPVPTYPMHAYMPQSGYADQYGQSPYMMSYPGYYPQDHLAPDLSRLSLEVDDHVVPRENHGSIPLIHPPAILASSMGAAQMPPSMHQQAMVPPLPAPHVNDTVISIPGEMVGRLIGRHGVAVKQLQSETRTRIDILDPSPNSSNATRYVRITGPKYENVHHCVQLIHSRMASFWGAAPMSPASSHHA